MEFVHHDGRDPIEIQRQRNLRMSRILGVLDEFFDNFVVPPNQIVIRMQMS